jgi:dihydrofolate synthase / folylpolyglutamate synthase
MSYSTAIDKLNTMVPELYAKPGQPRRKFSLDEIRILLHALGDPQKKFRSVLIAGTNGKGSTAATLASILAAAGQRTGLYTSPHLERPNERIKIDGAEICDDDFAALFFKVQEAAAKLTSAGELPQFPSYFEVLTAQAFLHFAVHEIDIAVLEVGMGGRLDATNVVDPLLSIITDISLEHTEWLGPTITDIAREKSGILRRGGIVITLPQHPEANQVIGETAEDLGAKVVSAVPYVPAPDTVGPYFVEALGAAIRVDSPLTGAHQQRNVALALAAAVELAAHHGFAITPAALEAGVLGTRWPGRLERRTIAGVDWILDVAHNPAGACALRAALHTILEGRRPQTLVFRCLRDKPLPEMARILFPLFDRVIVTPIHSKRAAAVEDLFAAASATATTAIQAESVGEALCRAQTLSAGGVAVVSGSVYLVGEARPLLVKGPGEAQ